MKPAPHRTRRVQLPLLPTPAVLAVLAVLAAAAAAAAAAAPAVQQAKTEKHPELGLTLVRPPGYEALPVRPRQRFGALAYVRRPSAPERARGLAPSTLAVYVVPHRAASGEKVVDAESFLRHEVGAEQIQELHPGRSRYGHQPQRWSAAGKAADGRPVSIFVHAWKGEERTIVIEGRCDPEAYAGERRVWEQVATGMRLFEPRDLDAERAKLERYYGQRHLRGVDYRIDARLALVDGWDARDTEHFIVVHHGVDDGFLRTLCQSVETLRREYVKHCPPDRNVDAISTIRICRDQAEYLSYGGWKGSVGYWSAGEEELVLFDATTLTGLRVDGVAYTLSVLFHEAFHQHVYYSAEGLAPPPWFNEGTAEYFAGARVAGGRLQELGVNPYRLPTVQQALRDSRTHPWEVVVGLDTKQFYADPELLYAQAWSMVHFLNESTVVRRRAAWKKILPTYFRTLRSAWGRERRRLGGASAAAVDEARRRARAKALEAAFKGVDWVELEAAWAQYTLALSLPAAK